MDEQGMTDSEWECFDLARHNYEARLQLEYAQIRRRALFRAYKREEALIRDGADRLVKEIQEYLHGEANDVAV